MNNGTTINVSLQDADINPNNTYQCYTFSAANAGNGVTNLTGYYRPETGCLYIEFIANSTYRVISIAQMYYPYTKYNFTNTEEASSKESPNGEMVISIDPYGHERNVGFGQFCPQRGWWLIHSSSVPDYMPRQQAQATKSPTVATSALPMAATCSTSLRPTSLAAAQVVNGTFTINEKYNGTIAGKAFAN